MYLNQLSLTDYRAFRAAILELPRDGITLIAGQNNSGKSSLLSALHIASGGSISESSCHALGSMPIVRAKFNLDSFERKNLFAALQWPTSGLETGALRWIEWEFKQWRVSEPAYVSRIFASSVDGEECVIAKVDTSGAFNWSVSGHLLEESLQLPWKGVAPTHAISNASMSGAPGRSAERIGIANDKFDISALMDVWRSSFFYFPSIRPGGKPSNSLRSDRLLNSDGSNLAAVLLDLRVNRPQLWSKCRDMLAKMIPDVGRLSLRTYDDKISIIFDDPHLPSYHHNLKDLGAGVEQILLTLVACVAHGARAMIAIEEPETGLHPGAQRALLAFLNQQAAGMQFVITTHSPVMLDTKYLGTSIHSVKRNRGISTLAPVPAEAADVLVDLGVRLSDVLSAERILLVEGPSDREVLSRWFSDLILDPRIIVVTGQGGDNARFARLLESWMSESDRVQRRRVLYLRDRDELTWAEVVGLEKASAVYVLKKRELENYLFDPVAITNLLLALPGVAAVPPPEEISSAIRLAADSLRPVVTLKRVCRMLRPIRLVDNDTRRALADETADVDRLIEVVCHRIPDREDVGHRIRAMWAEEESAIDSMWDEHWLDLVPGADVLDVIFRKYAMRKFRKIRDGAALAELIDQPPSEISDVIKRFLLEE
jgi:energy-coupling factor transporter ATP-binding protein EcfA2